ncbi:MAG: S-adenosylmethionine:tRNA ribosyltransferase-isomerase [Gemmatimonadales bacterium]
MTTAEAGFDFRVSDDLAAHEPPEARGLARDEVRLMVSRMTDNVIRHTRFFDLPEFLDSGDVVVVNTSATINAALAAKRESRDGSEGDIELHLSAPLSQSEWVVEVRRQTEKGTSPLLDARQGEQLRLPGGGTAKLLAPYRLSVSEFANVGTRLWIAELNLPDDVPSYTARHGQPIRYGYVPESWPLSYYQTVCAREAGSAEMPSAGRAFTHEIVERLARQGVRIIPILLHTGVSSLEAGELPYPERYRVPRSTAVAINAARSRGGRVVAVGTTVVRALETVAGADGRVKAGQGWTDLVITPERHLHVVDALLTGLHEPKASHLAMLGALAGRDHIALAYEAALSHRYLWHEFGDMHLIL